jgi:hypothetical protein
LASLVRAAELLVRIRDAADLEPDEDRVSDVELLRYANVVIAEIHEILVRTCEDYATSPTPHPIVTSAGVSAYDLPDDFYRLRAVLATLSGELVTLRPWRLEELALYEGAAAWVSSGPIAYHRMEDKLVFKPTPQGVYNVSLYYAKAPVKLVSSDDEVDFQAGWEEAVVAGAAADALMKDELDASAHLAKKAYHMKRIVSNSATSDLGEPGRIIRRRTAPRGRWPWPPR